ncbi:MAG TPA: DUF4386 domain-containing protein [Chthoniobacterales bacterium]|jgi:hypothetical protein|nr:DUF4386 domain-containing protein [Chthoniobacterales bacterium]
MSTDVMTDGSARPKTIPAAITPTQHRAAKWVGALYLIQMALAIFGESCVRGRLIVREAGQTAANITGSETLFRLSIATDLLVYATVIGLVWGIYVILKPINQDAALLGAFLRLVENAILAVTALTAFIALRLLSGATYLQPFEPAELQALARLFLSVYGVGLSIGFVFLGFGSAIFSYVWFQSRYIPKALAGWGIFASVLLAIASLVTMVFPRLYAVLGMSYMMPMGIYEIGLGLWLLIRGLKPPTPQTV